MRLLGMLLLVAPAALAWEPPSHRETGLALAAGVMLAADAAQTCSALGPTRGELPPMAWIIGQRPSCGTVAVGALASTAALGAAWWFLPHPYRSVLAGGTLIVEFGAVTHNAAWGMGFKTPW